MLYGAGAGGLLRAQPLSDQKQGAEDRKVWKNWKRKIMEDLEKMKSMKELKKRK